MQYRMKASSLMAPILILDDPTNPQEEIESGISPIHSKGILLYNEELKKENRSLKDSLEYASSTIQSLKSQNLDRSLQKNQQERIRELQQQVSRINRQVYHKSVQIDVLNNEKKQFEERTTKCQAELRFIIERKEQNEKFSKFTINKLKEKLRKTEQATNTSQSAINNLSQQITQLHQENKRLLKGRSQLEQNNRSIRKQLEETKTILRQREIDYEDEVKHLFQLLQEKQDTRVIQQQETLCIICRDEQARMGLYPCGHITFCKVCVNKIGNRCPVCKKGIQHRFQFFTNRQ